MAVWGYWEDPIEVDRQNVHMICTKDVNKRCYVASSYCTNDVGVIGWALSRYQKMDNQVIIQQGGYGLLIYSYDTHDNICIENA